MLEALTSVGRPGLIMADPAAMGRVLWPDLETEGNDAHCEVECCQGLCYGMLVEDATGNAPVNCHTVHGLDGAEFKRRINRLFVGH